MLKISITVCVKIEKH